MASIRVLNNGSIAQDRYVAFTVPYAIAAGLNSTLPSKLGVTIGSTEYEAFAVKQENTSPGGTGTPNDTDKLLFLCKGPWPTGADTYTLDAPGNNEPDVLVFPPFLSAGGGEQCGPPSLVSSIGGLNPEAFPRYYIRRGSTVTEVGTFDIGRVQEVERTATRILYFYRTHDPLEGVTVDYWLEAANGSNLARWWMVPNYYNSTVAGDYSLGVDGFQARWGQEVFWPYGTTVNSGLLSGNQGIEWDIENSSWSAQIPFARELPVGYGYIFGRVAGTTVTADENLYADIKNNGDIDGHGSALLDRTSWQNYWGPWEYLPTSDTQDTSVTNIDLATADTRGVGRIYGVGSEAAPGVGRRNDNTGYQSAWGCNFGGDIVDGKITMDTVLVGSGGYHSVVQAHFRERDGSPIEFRNHPSMGVDSEWIPWVRSNCTDNLGKTPPNGEKLRLDEPDGIARVHGQQHTVLSPLWTEYGLTMNPLAWHNIHDVMQMAAADHRIFRPGRDCGSQDSNHREFARRVLSVMGCGIMAPDFREMAREYVDRAYQALRAKYIGNFAIRNGNPLRLTRTAGQTSIGGGASTFYWDPIFDAWCPLMVLLGFERGWLDAAARDFALENIEAAWQYGSCYFDPLGGSNRYWFLAYRMAHTLDGTNNATPAAAGTSDTNLFLRLPGFGNVFSDALRTDNASGFSTRVDPGNLLRSWQVGIAVAVREYAENGKDPSGILSTETKNRAYDGADSCLAFYHNGTPAQWLQISIARFGSIFSPY